LLFSFLLSLSTSRISVDRIARDSIWWEILSLAKTSRFTIIILRYRSSRNRHLDGFLGDGSGVQHDDTHGETGEIAVLARWRKVPLNQQPLQSQKVFA
jgi:hypothetical protein